jgi:site-specific recombinase XerD
MAYTRQKPIEIIDREDLDQLLAACGRSITGQRNQAILATLYFAGLRTAEALALRPADVKLNADATATLNVRCGKGGKQRHVTLAAPGVPDLASWLDVRAQRVTTARTAPLFCTHASGRLMTPGQPLDGGYVRAMLARLTKRVEIGKRVHAHGFRHAHASYLHHRGVPLAAIQTQLGHSSPLTTVRYLASIGAHDAHRHVAAAFADAS